MNPPANPPRVSAALQPLVDDAAARIVHGLERWPNAVFATSFGAEDMLLLDLLDAIAPDLPAFTLDTGRLPVETHALISESRGRYRIRPRVLSPRAEDVEAYVERHGPDGFYGSVELRRACCEVRKLHPLRRALAGVDLWIVGLRREQGGQRAELGWLEPDAANPGLMKLAPLADWTSAQVRAYLGERDVPVNALHGRGYPSIGCAPCTRAVSPGEHERTGRWWWELPESRECGLHVAPGGRLVRSRDAPPIPTES